MTLDDDRRDVARRINPVYADGDLVWVYTARQQPEAEMIQGMLLEEGIPSTYSRAAGFDVPDMLAAGPRDIRVPRSGAEAARRVLHEAEMVGDPRPDAGPPLVNAKLLLLWLVIVVVLVAIVILLFKA